MGGRKAIAAASFFDCLPDHQLSERLVMTRRKPTGKTILRKIIVWGIILFLLPTVVLGAPEYKIVGLIIIAAVILWDTVVATNKPAVAKNKASNYNTDSTETSYLLSEIKQSKSEPELQAVTSTKSDTVSIPKRPLIIAIVLILVIGAYSIGYSTGKNTAIRIDKETRQNKK